MTEWIDICGEETTFIWGIPNKLCNFSTLKNKEHIPGPLLIRRLHVVTPFLEGGKWVIWLWKNLMNCTSTRWSTVINPVTGIWSWDDWPNGTLPLWSSPQTITPVQSWENIQTNARRGAAYRPDWYVSELSRSFKAREAEKVPQPQEAKETCCLRDVVSWWDPGTTTEKNRR